MAAAAMRQQRQEQEASCKATEDHRSEFDAAKPPPFRIGDVRAAVPAHCWRKSPLRSLSYVVRDVAVVAALAAAAWGLDSWAVWPLYWAVQGTMFWALFVLGHDWYVSASSPPNQIDAYGPGATFVRSSDTYSLCLIAVVMAASPTAGRSTASSATCCTLSSSSHTTAGNDFSHTFSECSEPMQIW
jgi:hypothetical protein